MAQSRRTLTCKRRAEVLSIKINDVHPLTTSCAKNLRTSGNQKPAFANEQAMASLTTAVDSVVGNIGSDFELNR